MIQPTVPRTLFVQRLRMCLAAVVIGVSAAGICVLGFAVSDQIDHESSAGSDNMQWALAQVDVELLQLALVLDSARQDAGQLPAVRNRFDIFYSRMKTLGVGRVFDRLRASPGFTAGFLKLQGFVEDEARLMDGPDGQALAGLDLMRARVDALIPDAHRLALTGVSAFALEEDNQRLAVQRTLIELALLTLGLVVALVVMLVRVLRLGRGNRIKVVENAEMLARLDAVVATSLDPVITLDEAGRIVDFNPAASQIFGLARHEAFGQDLNLLIPPDANGDPQVPPVFEAMPKGRRRLRITARHNDGHDFPAEVSLSSAQAGSHPVHVVFLRDLSQQLEAERALVTARDDALAGEKAKAELLVVMSHEIRTPLNGMIGTIELLEATSLAPHQREYLRIMAASGRLLMHHVNDVLDIARLDSGKSTLDLAPVDLVALIDEVLENQRPGSLTQANRLTFVRPHDGRHVVQADAALLRQVMLNLVGNAMKFTHDGTIAVSVTHLTQQGPTEIVVQDSGVGIAAGDLGRIFEDFVTLDPSYARRTSGTGLGLGIVRRIVTRMGGQIAVESEVGVGTTFRVTLPMTILAKDVRVVAAAPPQRQGGAGLSVLVVDDNDFNRLIVQDMLVQDGHRVVTASDGEQGVQVAQTQRFDVILMDISMPGLDGVQAARRIRSDRGASRRARIIALTAHALPAETASFRASGLEDVLVKPITRDTLRAVLASQPAAVPFDAEGLVDLDSLADLEASMGEARVDGLITRFLADTEARMALLVEMARDTAQEAELVAEVHRMSGTAAMFGASALHDRLTRIEDLCKLGQRAAARAAVPALAVLWQRTAAAYRDRAYRTGGSFAQASSLR